jgi:hypothetical protein
MLRILTNLHFYKHIIQTTHPWTDIMKNKMPENESMFQSGLGYMILLET